MLAFMHHHWLLALLVTAGVASRFVLRDVRNLEDADDEHSEI